MTARNLRLIAEARMRRGDVVEWTDGLERQLVMACQ
jgi:hypothetical protein